VKPDLESPDGRRAYGAELNRVARGWRWTGLSLVVLAAAGYVMVAKFDAAWTSLLGVATIAGLMVGWGLAIVGVVKRTRYHKARMAGWPGNV
jgi:hypothetical protein